MSNEVSTMANTVTIEKSLNQFIILRPHFKENKNGWTFTWNFYWVPNLGSPRLIVNKNLHKKVSWRPCNAQL